MATTFLTFKKKQQNSFFVKCDVTSYCIRVFFFSIFLNTSILWMALMLFRLAFTSRCGYLPFCIIRHHMQKLSEQELREIEDDRHRRVREIKLRREIQGKTKETPRPRPEEKRKEFR